MGSVKFEFKIDEAKFWAKYNRLTPDVIDHARVRFKDLAERAHKMIKELTPATKQGSTDIKALWELEMTTRGQVESYLIHNLYPNQDVLAIFEEGARRHMIRPTRKMLLAWEDEQTGETIFAKNVAHPGYKGAHMVARTWMTVAPLIAAYEKLTLDAARGVMSK